MKYRLEGAIACAFGLLLISYGFVFGQETRDAEVASMCNNFGGFTIDGTMYFCSQAEIAQ